MTEKRPTLRDRIRAVRGQTYLVMGRHDQALADFDRAIELDPTEDEFTAARTEISQLTGRSDADDALPSNRETTGTLARNRLRQGTVSQTAPFGTRRDECRGRAKRSVSHP